MFEDHKTNTKTDNYEPRNIVDFLLEMIDDPSPEVKLTFDKLKTFAQVIHRYINFYKSYL